MFFRNVCSAADLAISCKPGLLRCNSNSINNGRVQIRSSFQNSRRGARRPAVQANPLEQIHVDTGPLHPKDLFKPFVFTVGVSTASLVGCVIWEYESLRSHASSLLKRPGNWISAQQKKITSQFKTEPGSIQKWWNSLRTSEKVFYPILAANVLVFGAWRVRTLQPFMVKYFCSNPSGNDLDIHNSSITEIHDLRTNIYLSHKVLWLGFNLVPLCFTGRVSNQWWIYRFAAGAKCLPMVLSTFSHHSILHLAANMYVLYSFMPAAVAFLGKEQFVAMYMSAGVISSFASFLYKVMLNQPGLSLGASGAIMSVLSYVCVQYPDTRLSIIFLPMYTFAAGTAIKVIMSVDLAGVVLGWKFFDHAAHLGGALFGMAWCYWGGHHLWGNRDKFLQYYHNFRKDSR